MTTYVMTTTILRPVITVSVQARQVTNIRSTLSIFARTVHVAYFTGTKAMRAVSGRPYYAMSAPVMRINTRRPLTLNSPAAAARYAGYGLFGPGD